MPELLQERIDTELALLGAEEAEERRRCPLLYFSTEKRPHQTPFFYDTHAVCGLFSGNKAGKDYVVGHRLAIAYCRGRLEPLDLPGSFEPFRRMRAIQMGEPLKTRYYVPVLDTWHSVIVPILLRAIPYELRDGKKSSDGSGHNKGECTIHLRDGSWIKGMSYEGHRQDEQKSEAVELDFGVMSEIPPEDLFDQFYVRTLTTGGYIWLAATRNEKSSPYPMAWVRRRIILKGDGNHVAHYRLSTEENILAVADEVGGAAGERIRKGWEERKAGLSPEDRAVMLDGEWSGEGGIVYGTFNEQDHVYEMPEMTPEVFVALAQQGFGDVWAGMDHGCGCPTVVVYEYIARKPLEELRIIEGDYIQIGEYYRANARIVDHMPALQELHRRFLPLGYFCDPHMWDNESSMGGLSPAALYSEPKRLRDIVRARYPDTKFPDLLPVAPLHKGRNEAGSVDAGIQCVEAMLRRRPGPFAWPRMRLLHVAGVNECPWTTRGFQEWQRKSESELRVGEDRYSHWLKDPMDAKRYVAMARPDMLADAPQTVYRVPVHRLTGIPITDFCSLAGGYGR